MTNKLDGIPDCIEYGGFRCEYAGTSTITDKSGATWFRHEYSYCDMPHIKERVFFFRTEGDDEPIPLVTDGFVVSFDRERRKPDLPYIAEKKRRYNEYQRAYKRRVRAKSLAEKIRGQIKPLGDE